MVPRFGWNSAVKLDTWMIGSKPSSTAWPKTFCAPCILVVSISLVWRGSVATNAALCTTASQPRSASRTETRSVMSPTAKSDTSAPSLATDVSRRAGSRTRNRTECPASAMTLAVLPPTHPVPPVTRTRMRRFCNGATSSNSRGLADGPVLQVTGGEVSGLVRHAVDRIQRVGDGAAARTADAVALSAQLEGLGHEKKDNNKKGRGVDVLA